MSGEALVPVPREQLERIERRLADLEGTVGGLIRTLAQSEEARDPVAEQFARYAAAVREREDRQRGGGSEHVAEEIR